MNQPVERLCPGLGITPIAELATVCPKPIPKLALVHIEMRAWLRTADCQPLQHNLGRSLRRPPRLFDGGF
jgi:hypothetical protein